MAISFWGRSMAISLWAVHWPFFYWPFDGHFPCDWVLVLCGRGPSAPARRVSTGLVSPVITAFRHFPPFAFNMLILASLDPMLFFFCVYIFFFLLLLTTTTLFTNTAVLCRCKGSKRRLMVVFTDVVDLASRSMVHFRCELGFLVLIVNSHFLQFICLCGQTPGSVLGIFLFIPHLFIGVLLLPSFLPCEGGQ